MRALTLIQPWASLVAEGRKTVETRSWPTSVRGRIAIHAGKKVDKNACKKFGYEASNIITSAIIATVALVDCVQFPHPDIQPDKYGDFSSGRYGFVLKSIKREFPPKHIKGHLGFWEWKRS